MTIVVTRNALKHGVPWLAAAAMSILFALVSFRYLVGIGPFPPKIVANAFAVPWLTVHVAASGLALLIGIFQFLRSIRLRRIGVHRWLGRFYVAACVAGGLTGLPLAFGTTMGPVTTAGFAILSIAWLFVTIRGWREIRAGHVVAHREWMVRSWALTFAAVNLRLYLGIAFVLSIPFAQSYPVISFLAWVPNLIVAEIYLRRRPLPVGSRSGRAA